MNNKINPYIVEYPATYDIIFHNAFSNKETLASFTSALLNVSIRPEEIQILTPKLSEGINFKTTHMDIRYSIIEKMDIDLEMQKNKPNYNMEDRLVYYAAQQLVHSMEKGQVYTYKRCCTICITDFSLFKSKECIKHFELIDIQEQIKIRGIEIIAIDLTKKDKCDNIELKKWLEIMTATNLEQYKGGNRIMDQTIERIVESNKDKDIQELILMRKREEFEEKMKRAAEIRLNEEKQQFKQDRQQFNQEQKQFSQEQKQFNQDKREFNKNKQKFNQEQQQFNQEQQQFNQEQKQFSQDKQQLETKKMELEAEKIELETKKTELENQKIKFAKNLLQMNMKIEEISEITGLDIEKIKEL